ncbi:MAG: hypothetical protein MH321_06060 [Leptospiraceae bacterium]|nr:hypothetical protein [Leptospiraceae bacterium]
MALNIDSIELLKQHVAGVMERADHHAKSVYKIVLPLIGLVVWKADNIQARTNQGETANMIWFEVVNKRYALVFNHIKRKIEIREKSQQGKSIIEIDNDTNLGELIDIFNTL